MSAELAGKIAVVTGASRGIGRGTAIALAEKGATVYVTGRTSGTGELTIDRTVELVEQAGGRGVAVLTDHGDDALRVRHGESRQASFHPWDFVHLRRCELPL